jgi:antibiotic biosynthesis monooxygenase (ABM) superfamily enzyme
MIRIVSVKVFIPHLPSNRIYQYSSGLTQLASVFPGFVQSENLWNYKIDNTDNIYDRNCDTMFTISKWKSDTDWNNWLHSKERKQYLDYYLRYTNFGDIVKTATFYKVNEGEMLNNWKGY